MGIPVKKPSLSEPNSATDSVDRGFWVLLPVDAVNYLERTAQSKAISVERLLQQLITEHVTEETRSLEDRMNHLNELLKELVVAVKNPQMLPKRRRARPKPARNKMYRLCYTRRMNSPTRHQGVLTGVQRCTAEGPTRSTTESWVLTLISTESLHHLGPY